jgi:hypothetical protein
MTWLIVAAVLLIASAAITALASSPAKSQITQPNQFKDFQFPVPEEGTPQAVIFGDVWTNDWQVLWVGNYQTKPIYASTSGGKK